MNVILEILIMILILGVLVSIHEAGHLGMAKLFKVYCFEYSIGMGPAILHKKKKGHETYFSIRCIPFGGYVSMYGEAEDIKLDEGEELPPKERSLEYIAKWKKIIVLFAGVFLNFVLGLVLLFMSVSLFPQYFTNTNSVNVSSENDILLVCNTVNDDYTAEYIANHKSADFEVSDYQLSIGFSSYKNENNEELSSSLIISTDVTVTGTSTSTEYIAIYSPSTLTSDHYLADDLYFYKKSSTSVRQIYSDYGVTALPDVSAEKLAIEDSKTYTVTMNLLFMPVAKGFSNDENFKPLDYKISVPYTFDLTESGISGLDLKMEMNEYYYSWDQMWDRWSYLVPYSCGAIIKGIFTLFTPSGLSNASGIVGMTVMVGAYSSMGGAAYVFLFAGLISINLAFFNLLPFPGLDGYQIVVTAIEGITKKKVPSKVKSIVSFVGLALLILLMVFITVKDIIGLF